MPYLVPSSKPTAYDIPIEAVIELPDQRRYHVATCNTKNVIWSFEQMIAHHTISGCPLESGDLIATGTLSGPTFGELGCLYEMSRGGEQACKMKSETSNAETLKRVYLEDGDTVEFSTSMNSPRDRGRVGFGTCRGTQRPSTSVD